MVAVCVLYINGVGGGGRVGGKEIKVVLIVNQVWEEKSR